MGMFTDVRRVIGVSDLSPRAGKWRALVAELVGTMMLVLIGCFTCINVKQDSGPGIVGIALAFGVTVATIAQSIGHVSGGHINPAVTIGMLVAGKISIVMAIGYIIVQCAGAIIGSALLQGLTPDASHATLGMTALDSNVTPAQGFGVEVFITFLLVLVVFAATDDRRNDVTGSAPLAIGLSITACHLGAIQYTGSSMNPARTFGPAVIGGQWEDHWVYWAGPIVGGVVASALYTLVFRPPRPTSIDSDNKSEMTKC